MKFNIHSETELPTLIPQLLQWTKGKKKIMLQGEMGAGKTTLVKAFCNYFNVKDYVTSPTFSIINEYTYQDVGKQEEKYIYHIDLYRLNTLEEALDIGIEEYLYDGHYCFIEWPELIQSLLPEDIVIIQLKIMSNFGRKIVFL